MLADGEFIVRILHIPSGRTLLKWFTTVELAEKYIRELPIEAHLKPYRNGEHLYLSLVPDDSSWKVQHHELIVVVVNRDGQQSTPNQEMA